MPDQHVRPKLAKLTDEDVRKLLSYGLLNAIRDNRLEKVRVEAGCDEKTIRRARDLESTLGFAFILNLLDLDEHIMDAPLAAKGFMLIPTSIAAGDVIPAAGAAIHRIGQNRDPGSPGGTRETDQELVATEAENDALLAAVIDRRAQIVRAKARLSGLAA